MVSPPNLPAAELDLLGSNLDRLPHWQTLDITPPTTSVQPLPVQSPGPFWVNWSGSDGGGAGIKNFDLQVRDGPAGTWTDWLTGFAATTAAYPGVGGHTYYFRVRGRDQAFNLQTWPVDYQAVTTVETLPPQSAVAPLPAYSSSQVSVSWSGSDPGGSGVKSYDIQTKDVTSGGLWTDWQMNTSQTSAVFNGTSEHRYAFRSRAVDNALNQESWPAGETGDTLTTLASFVLEGTVMANTGSPIGGAVITTNPPAFLNAPSQPNGRYGAYVTTGNNSATAGWSKPGYGSLPQTTFDVPSKAHVDVVLPPSDNVVTNTGLEFATGIEAPWLAGGEVLPAQDTRRHTGSSAVRLGEAPGGFADEVDFPLTGVGYANIVVADSGIIDVILQTNSLNTGPRRITSASNSTLSQTLTLPPAMTTPILSFFYDFAADGEADGASFEVQVAQGTTTTSLLSTTAKTAD